MIGNERDTVDVNERDTVDVDERDMVDVDERDRSMGMRMNGIGKECRLDWEGTGDWEWE